ncbi:MAG TPA: sulfite oxidase-like oxidoreductase [Actinomycetota bacterium]|nr:sulfite oxidase-like oxidoreductase [Actinomycetota bacterium]
MTDRDRLLRLLHTADNFVKYSGGSTRGHNRARHRLETVLAEAERTNDTALIEQVRLRLDDLDRVPASPETEIEPEQETSKAPLPEHAAKRVPPGQRVRRGWPVLHEGPVPAFDPEAWRFTVRGEVAMDVELGYSELRSLPTIELASDFHCVTGWSRLDNRWRGVRSATVLDLAGPLDDARHAVVHAEYGYTANLPLDVLREDTSILAWGHDGTDLAPKHGYPLRLVVPRLYGWKSVKWVRSFELLTEDRRGFWEVRGYHNRADPWLEERYSYQES